MTPSTYTRGLGGVGKWLTRTRTGPGSCYVTINVIVISAAPASKAAKSKGKIPMLSAADGQAVPKQASLDPSMS